MEPTLFQKYKELMVNPELQYKAFLDSDLRFSVNVEWAGIVVQFIGIFSGSIPLIAIGTGAYFYGLIKYFKNLERVYDDWTKEKKEKKEETYSKLNEG